MYSRDQSEYLKEVISEETLQGIMERYVMSFGRLSELPG